MFRLSLRTHSRTWGDRKHLLCFVLQFVWRKHWATGKRNTAAVLFDQIYGFRFCSAVIFNFDSKWIWCSCVCFVGFFYSRDIGFRFSNSSTIFTGPLVAASRLKWISNFFFVSHANLIERVNRSCGGKKKFATQRERNSECVISLEQTRLQCDKLRLRQVVVCAYVLGIGFVHHMHRWRHLYMNRVLCCVSPTFIWK